MMRYFGVSVLLAALTGEVACRKLELEPRLTVDAEAIYQDYTVNHLATFSGSTMTDVFTYDAVFSLGKGSPSIALPAGDIISCNGVALTKTFGAGTAVSYHLSVRDSRPTAFVFVWTEANGTTHKNTVAFPTQSASFEAPATTVSRSQALTLHWADSTPASSQLVVAFTQATGVAVAPTVVKGTSPTLQFSLSSMNLLSVGSATLTTTAALISPLIAPTAAGGQVTYTDTFSYPVSITN